jgi:hypothetical protein
MPVKKQYTKKQVPEPGTNDVSNTPDLYESDSKTPYIKQLPKAGRTLLIKSKTSSPIDLSKYEPITGLLSKSDVNQHNSIFLTFDTIENSELAFNLINPDYNVKYSYYKIFFTLSTNIDTNNYESTKNEVKSYIESSTGASMLYCKFYRKNSSYMNCGDLIVDTIDAMKKLISKESNLKQFNTSALTGTFYRFNNSKYKTSTDN